MDSGIFIIGEVGVGYVIDKQYYLLLIMFDVDEIEVIVLGIGMVSNWMDVVFVCKVKSVYEKIQVMFIVFMV